MCAINIYADQTEKNSVFNLRALFVLHMRLDLSLHSFAVGLYKKNNYVCWDIAQVFGVFGSKEKIE